jgi:glycosyltransferase involved in cell wall biosynthesis
VYQRIVGFKHAKGDYVLQLDDDILLNNRCLERLVISLDLVNKQ